MMMEKQTVCLRQLGGTRAGEMKLGRWLANESVTKEELAQTITDKVHTLANGRHVLAIQDSSELNYQAHVNRVKGLGPVGNNKDVGFFIHPMLVMDAEDATCLGFSDIKIWIREWSKKANRKILPIEEKESYRWLEVAERSKRTLSQASKITVIADRESDIYEEWARIPDQKTHLITRACRDRKLWNQQSLFSYVSTLEVKGTYKFKVDNRVGKRSAHEAELKIRYGEIEIKKPGNCLDNNAPNSIKLRVVDVRELPKTVVGKELPIHWCLLTTHDVSGTEDALQIVRWYCLRWNIEQLFRTLKRQGLDLESSQLETADGLIKLTILALSVALQTMQLTLARDGKDQHISVVFNEEERKVLLATQKTLECKTDKQKNHHSPEKLSWAAWIIARLGGWKRYQSESPPGPITMLTGITEFNSLVRGYCIAKMCA